MPSVLFWPGVGGGTEHYRCRTPGAALTRAGWDVTYAEDDDTDFAVDVVVLQRVLHPQIPDIIEALQAHGVTVVYDVDDWYDQVPTYNPFRPGDLLATLHAALARADLVTVSTTALAEGYARFGPVAVLPNYLDPDLWSTTHRTPSPHVRVGWMGHLGHRSADVDLLVPWLADWLEDTGCEFVNAGSGPELAEHLGVPVRRPAGDLRPYEQLPTLLGNFDIGLVPLARNRFNDAKSWCKGLEYSAAGAAVVASPSREYRAFIEPGVNGQLVDRQRWADALYRTLGHLPAMQANARAVAERYFIDDHIDRWTGAYAQARQALTP